MDNFSDLKDIFVDFFSVLSISFVGKYNHLRRLYWKNLFCYPLTLSWPTSEKKGGGSTPLFIFWNPLKPVQNLLEGIPKGLRGFQGLHYYINIYKF